MDSGVVSLPDLKPELLPLSVVGVTESLSASFDSSVKCGWIIRLFICCLPSDPLPVHFLRWSVSGNYISHSPLPKGSANRKPRWELDQERKVQAGVFIPLCFSSPLFSFPPFSLLSSLLCSQVVSFI